MIEIEHVSYTYPNASRPVLHDLTLTIHQGEFLVVCGPSGAGKSSFLRMLNGLVPHFYGGRFVGDVRVWGRSTRTHQPRDMADLIGFVFQDPEAQFVVDIVEDEIVFAMENLGLPPRLMRRRVEEVLDQLGIARLRRRRISSLSGGEQQRVAIASVLAAQPRALVLDEPTSQIDPHGAEEVLTALQKLNDDLGLTIVLCEHRLERVVQYADRVLYFPIHKEANANGLHTSPFAPPQPLLGPPRDVLAQSQLAPALVRLGQALEWFPLPLTIKEARRFAYDATSQQLATLAETQRSIDKYTPATARQPSVVVNRVHFAYNDEEALYNLSLTAYPGEVLALMGRNGSGKTTLLKLIVGLLKPSRGSISVRGNDVTRMAVEDVAMLVGYVPQDPRSLLFQDTLREEVAFTLHGRKTSDRRVNHRRTSHTAANTAALVEATLDQLGLAHLAERYPRDLSGGEAQRAALAAILVGDPLLLLLDEPTRGLDFLAKAELGQLLRQLAAQGRSIMIATHDVELVAAYADRVALLGDGELVVEGPVREVLSDSLIFSSQIAKLFPGTGWLTVEDVVLEHRSRI